eukprot:5108845-Amphidinium_carterae.1
MPAKKDPLPKDPFVTTRTTTQLLTVDDYIIQLCARVLQPHEGTKSTTSCTRRIDTMKLTYVNKNDSYEKMNYRSSTSYLQRRHYDSGR